jgi:HIRAN domain
MGVLVTGSAISTGKSYPFSELRDDPRFPHVRSIHTKIRGVTKENDDGVSRQWIIRQFCDSGDALYLEREPNNPVDHNAIKVRRNVYTDVADKPKLAEQMGYVSRELAEDLAPRMDNEGHVLMAKILDLTGNENWDAIGVNIQIEEYNPAKNTPRLKPACTLLNPIA